MRYITLYLVAIFFTVMQYAGAEINEKPEPVHISLISEEETIQPGHPFWVITRLQLEEGWHTYWKNPGDAGMATTIKWNLPEGFTASQINWPMPKRFTLEGVIGYGYDNEVLLLTQITPPKELPAGTTIELKADARWLICSDSFCQPGEAPLSVTLPASDKTPVIKKENADYFARAQVLIPNQIKGVQAKRTENALELHVPMPADGQLPVSVYFAPESPDAIDHSVDAIVKPSGTSTHYILSFKPGADKEAWPETLKGVVVASLGRDVMEPRTQAIEIETPIQQEMLDKNLLSLNDQSTKASQIHAIPVTEEFSGGLMMALLFAFVGGMILNLMPCVLPVVSFKILSFVKMAGQSRALTLKHGLMFSAGVMASFWALAGMLLMLQAYGRSVGWGFQLQEPLFVAFLAAVLLIFGLSLFGLFEMGTKVTSWAGSLGGKKREGFASSFFSGVLATAVATPCTGPFLGSAVGYAVTLPAYQAMMIFTALGFGMALPYLLMSAFPSLLRFMPKPGEWMETFKQLMGFLMLATVLWLMWVFGAQTSSLAMTMLLSGFFFLAIACWIYGKWGSQVHSKRSRIISSFFALICFTAGSYTIVMSTSPEVEAISGIQQTDTNQDIAWEPFSKQRIEELQKQGIPVLVDFTAKWCLICQVNHMVLSGNSVDGKITEKGVVRMKADWTKNDPEITEELRKHGRNSVPLYLLYGKDATESPEIMPQVLTSDIVLEYLAEL